MHTIWQLRPFEQKIAQDISRELNISPIVSSLLVQRGVSGAEQARSFLNPDLKLLTDPFALNGMRAGVERIQAAIKKQEKTVIYGDYDVDGVCSVVVLKECLARIGFEVDYYVPDRFSEGYGLNREAIQHLTEQGYRLLITVDCGITSVEETELARQSGLDIIITDHHTPPAVQPAAAAIINPKNDRIEATAYLAGVGVSYKLAAALMQTYGLEIGKEWLDLVALATVADIVPLMDENRILVKYGLEALAKTHRPGLRALMQKTSLTGKSLQAWHVGFVLAPHINSAGRLDSARKSVELLLTADEAEAELLAEQLCGLNTERRLIEADIYQQAVQEIEKGMDLGREYFLVAGGEGWHEGVIGIVASRLANNYNRPALVISWNGEHGKGSARSAGGIDIYQALNHCQSLLVQFGGHKQAGGLTLQKQQLGPFKQALQEYISAEELLDPNCKIHMADMELEEEEINPELLADINQLAPFGEGNPLPYFVLRSSPVYEPLLVGAKGEHLKSKTGSKLLDVIAFNRADLLGPGLDKCNQDLLFELNENSFRGRTALQLKIKDMKSSFYPDYLYGKTNNSARLAEAIQRTVEELANQRPVLFIYPGYRSLNKHLPLLQGLFKAGQLQELHGQLSPTARNSARQQLAAGQARVFLSTQAFWDYYDRGTNPRCGNRNTLPAALRYALALWPAEHASLNVLEESGVEVCIIDSNQYISLNTQVVWEHKPGAKGVVYANRASTIQGLNKSITNIEIEAGINDVRQRKTARQRFSKTAAGLLLMDGTHPDRMAQLGTIQEIILADSPFGHYELAAATDYMEDEQISVSWSFAPDDLTKNRSYLERIYPDQQLLQLIWQQMQSYSRSVIRTTQEKLAARLAADTGRDLRPLDLLPVLHILADLDLCRFEKSGSIIEIKLISTNVAELNVDNSPYYWEGQREKALLKKWAQSLNNNLVW